MRGSRAALAVVVLSAGAALAESGKPIGKWERKVSKTETVTLVVEEGRLHLKCTGEREVTIHADYAMTKDLIIYGVITSAEGDEEDAEELEREVVDQPFSCRFRVDEGFLVIRDLKVGGELRKEGKWSGRFRAVAEEPRAAPPAAPPPPTPVGAVPPVSSGCR